MGELTYNELVFVASDFRVTTRAWTWKTGWRTRERELVPFSLSLHHTPVNPARMELCAPVPGGPWARFVLPDMSFKAPRDASPPYRLEFRRNGTIVNSVELETLNTFAKGDRITVTGIVIESVA